MSEKVIQALARIKGVDAKLLREIMEIQEERQKAMAEVSAIIGVDVTFSSEEILENVAEQYGNKIMSDVEKMMGAILDG